MKELRILNCGIIGGFRQPLLWLFERMCADVMEARSARRLTTSDMAFFNKVLYVDGNGVKVWAKGSPLHSVFKQYDYNALVAFVHK